MSHISRQLIHTLEHHLSRSLNLHVRDELVFLIGTGRESTNREALCNWMAMRWGRYSLNAIPPAGPMEVTKEVYAHLTALQQLVYYGEAGPLPEPHDYLPMQKLTDTECQRAARAVYWLLRACSAPQYLDGGLALFLGGDGSIDSRITQWVRQLTPAYNLYPSEVTAPLANRLLQELAAAMNPWQEE